MKKKRGLTLGKFAPLHKGHQLLLDTALNEMDEVVVIIYDCPETTSVPLNIRSNWIRDLYPDVDVIEAWNGPTEVGSSAEIEAKHEDYILNELEIVHITHFYSSESYGKHMSEALGATNRVVDIARELVPVSGKEIRKDPFAFRRYLGHRVYRDLVTNVVFLGAPCAGKTTIAARLAKEYNTNWMHEFGREYWEEHHIDRRLSLDQLVEIAEGHLDREETLLQRANRFLFADTNALTTLMFSLHYHSRALPRLIELADQADSRYDLVFVCDIDIPYDDTWDRSGKANRCVLHKQLLGELVRRKVPFFLVSGDLQTRVRFVKSIIGKYKKYTNIVDALQPRE